MKRGQTEVSLGTILLVILGIIGLVVVGMFIYKAYAKGGEVTDALPGGFDVAVASCEYTASLGNKGSYCASFKEIKVGGKNQYASCDYLVKTWDAEVKIPEGEDWTCSPEIAKTYCEQIRTNEQEDYNPLIVVNGETCEDRDVKEFGYVYIVSGVVCKKIVSDSNEAKDSATTYETEAECKKKLPATEE